MATYYTTIDELDQRVQEVDSLLSDNLMSLAVLQDKNLDLDKMYQNAIHNLQGLLGFLGYTVSDEADLDSVMQELNRKIQELHSTTEVFNGELLRQQIINPLKNIVQDAEEKEIAKFKKLLKSSEGKNELIEIIDKLSDKIGQSIGIDIVNYTADDADLVAQIILDAIKGVTINFNTGQTEVLGYTSLSEKGINERIEKRALDTIAGATKGNIDSLISATGDVGLTVVNNLLILAQQQGIPVKSLFPESTKKLIELKTRTNTQGNTVTVYFDIYENIQELNKIRTERKARDFFEKVKIENPQLYEELVEKLVVNTTQFLQLDTTNLSGERAKQLTFYFEKAIRDIITNYPAALFMGSNTQGVIGILGEIQGLYYIYSIMGDNQTTVPPETLVKWIGGDTSAGSGTKTGADIFITIAQKAGYGIQIKNSMDEFSSTSFSDFTLKEGNETAFFSQLKNFGIDGNIISAIEDVFMMQGFNIGYRNSGSYRVIAGEPKGPRKEEYKTDYAKILNLIERAQRFMALAAAMIMRIQYLQDINYTESNTLWIIGGTAAISAAQILKDLINQINGVQSNGFKTSASTYIGKTNFTIVDYLNNPRNTRNLKTILRTSYNFHNL